MTAARVRRSRILLAGLAVLFTLGAGTQADLAAQDGAITGEVVDQSDLQPLQGVQVYVAGTDRGTLTDAEGRYRLESVPAGEVEVRAELVGYGTGSQTVQVTAGQVSTADFELSVEALALEEVVVTATGLQRSREVGNAVASIEATEVVESTQPTSVEGLLQSQSPGVAIRSNTGTVGTAGDIKIRGAGSISLTNRPLVYVDGTRITSGAFDAGVSGQDYSRLNDLNPSEIENIEIVKGPAASTLYGTEAAGGVIRITTKQGAEGTTRYNLRVEYGANWDHNEYQPTVWNPRSFFGEAAKDTLYFMRLLETDNPFRTGQEKTFSGNARGGVQGLSYYVSGQFADREGQTHRNQFERYNFRANVSITPSEDLDIRVSNGAVRSFTELPDADNSGAGLIAQSYLGFPWVMPIEHRDPNDPSGQAVRTCPQNVELARLTGAALSRVGFDGCSEKPGFGGRDQADLRTLTNSNQTLRYTGSAELTHTPLDAWTNRLTVGYDYVTDRWTELTPVDPARPFGSSSRGDLDNRQVRGQNLTLEASSALDVGLTEDLSSVTTLGFQYFREAQEQVEATGEIFPAGSPAVNNAVLNEGTDSYTETRTLGFFVQEQFSWRDRVFLTPAVRLDDNSAFGRELGLKTYPRVSGSWVVSDEAFAPDFLDVLKLRGAWGMSGKQPGANDALGLLSPSPVIMGGEEVLGVSPSRPGNEELEPETGKELEVGFDMRTWQRRLGLQFTAYFQNTEDALVQRPLAASSGFPGSRWENLGAMKNRGVEVSADVTALDRPDLSSEWQLSFSTNHNEVTKLEDPIILGAERHVEGYPFAGYWTKPVFINDAGEVEVRDEFEFMGESGFPKWEGSLSHTLRLFEGDLTFYGNFAFAGGHKLLNFSDVFRCRWIGGGTYGGVCSGIHKTNPDGSYTDEARIKQRASLNNFSSRPWVEDADWAKLRTLSMRVQLPERWISFVDVRDVSLRLVAENLATWTGYSGMDPENNWSGGTDEDERAEFYTVPPGRRVLTTLTVSF